MRPEIWKRLPSSPRITGAVTTSPLPFSNSRIAIRLPMFSRETSRMIRAPLASIVRCTAGSWVWPSKPGWASVRLSPVTITWRLTITGAPLRSMYFSLPNGTGPAPLSAERPSRLSSTMRISSVAVRPMMSLALAVSCTPGQLHHHPVGALLLDHRLGDAELVDPVVQGGDVLRDRRRLHPLGGVGLEVAGELEVDAVDAVEPLHVGQLVGRGRCAPPPASARRESAPRSRCRRGRCRHGGCSCRAAACARRRPGRRPSWSAPPSCRPASGSGRRRAGRGRGTSAGHAARSATWASARAG